jgi:glyoxylase-like metal-dependent hydrolase (beta-lactamase superfamily II)
MRIAGYELHALNLGHFRLDGGAMFGVVPKTLWQKVAPADDLNRIDLALRCLLLVSEERVALVDCGIGNSLGRAFEDRFSLRNHEDELAVQLAARGLVPSDVTDLILTHLHFDHAAGAVRRDAAGALSSVFPRARVHVQREQWEWAKQPSLRDRASFIPEILSFLDSDRLCLVDGNAEILPGVHARVCSGHTPGMQLIHLKAVEGDEELIFAADLVPSAAHLSPTWVMGYDLNPLLALSEKLALYEEISDKNCWLFFEHDPNVAFGKVSKRAQKHLIVESQSSF